MLTEKQREDIESAIKRLEELPGVVSVQVFTEDDMQMLEDNFKREEIMRRAVDQFTEFA